MALYLPAGTAGASIRGRRRVPDPTPPRPRSVPQRVHALAQAAHVYVQLGNGRVEPVDGALQAADRTSFLLKVVTSWIL